MGEKVKNSREQGILSSYPSWTKNTKYCRNVSAHASSLLDSLNSI